MSSEGLTSRELGQGLAAPDESRVEMGLTLQPAPHAWRAVLLWLDVIPSALRRLGCLTFPQACLTLNIIIISSGQDPCQI